MNKDNYKGQFDDFEVPSNMWNNIESKLDTEKTKRRAIVWWRVAGVAILLLGIGAVLTYTAFGTNKVKLANHTVQKEKTPAIPVAVDSVSQRDPNDITTEQNALRGHEAPVDLNVMMSAYDGTAINNITTAVPFVGISSDARSGGTGAVVNSSDASYTPIVTMAASNDVLLTTQSNTYAWTNATTIANGTTSQGFINQPTYVANGTAMNAQTQLVTGISTPQGNFSTVHDPQFHSSDETMNTTRYDAFVENAYIKSTDEPVSTFSIDVDGASYSDIRGSINRGVLPNKDAVRIEEFINYFPYEYSEPKGEHPFSIHSEVGDCPWNDKHKLMKVGIKGKSIEKTNLPKNNLVFLLDVSGSMASAEKLELLKKGFRLLVNELREEDRVSICVYAGAAGLVLPPTSGQNKDKILDALDKLSAGGSTAGGQGIELAYATAQKHFEGEGNNRVILATDGDFNVGISNDDALVKLIEEKRKSGVFLTVLGFGYDNYQSSKMEKLANNGNGNFSYIDNILEAKKVLVTEMGATLQTIAKDVKIQMEFNPALVSKYRLVGYENRMLQNQDFNNDTIDAGELGAGHTVTAIYEIIPADGDIEDVEYSSDLKYSNGAFNPNDEYSDEMATMKFRYKEPDGTKSKLIEKIVPANTESISEDFQFVQAVIEFGLILRDSKYAGSANFDSILLNAREAKGDDPFGYRSEFIRLVEQARVMHDLQRKL